MGSFERAVSHGSELHHKSWAHLPTHGRSLPIPLPLGARSPMNRKNTVEGMKQADLRRMFRSLN